MTNKTPDQNPNFPAKHPFIEALHTGYRSTLGEIAALGTQLEAENAALKNENERLLVLSRLDPLTGILSRQGVIEEYEGLTREKPDRRAGEVPTTGSHSILFVDVDNFKEVNDTLSHSGGDMVLQTIAEAMRGATRKNDIVSRWGGDEFAVILPRTEPEAALIVAEKIREEVHQPVEFGSKTLTPSVSIGVGEVDSSRTLDELVQIGDRAMYKAKERGRNQVVFLESEA